MIAAFDLDGTLLKHNSSFAFCRFLLAKKILSLSEFLFCTNLYIRHKYFGLSFHHLHHAVFAHLFAGRSIEELSPLVEAFLYNKLTHLWYLPALERLRFYQARREIDVLILSNSPRFLVEPIAKAIGVNKVFATEYRIDSKSRLCDIATFVDGKTKAELINQMGDKETIAFSDSEHDLPFLNGAKIAVAVKPNRKLKKIAKQKDWEII